MSEAEAGSADQAEFLGELIERFNDAWNRQDVEAAMACHKYLSSTDGGVCIGCIPGMTPRSSSASSWTAP